MIFSDSQEKAEQKLNELISELDEDILKRTKDYVKTSTKTFQARRYSDNCRGYRYQKVYIDNSLDSDSLDGIFAKLVPPHYYNNVERDENYNWKEHVHYF